MKTASPRLLSLAWAGAMALAMKGSFAVAQEAPHTTAPAQIVVSHVRVEGLERTHADIVRRELLFAQGSPLDSAALAESLRNLRKLPFLSAPRFSFALSDTATESLQAVEITVHARDRYARALSPLLSGELDHVNLGIVALDYNFRGRGQSLQMTLDHHHIEGQRVEIDFLHPRLRHGRHALQVRGGVSSEGHLAQLRLSRPFRRLSDPYTYGFSLFRQRRIDRRYSSGSLVARFSDQSTSASVWLGSSSGTTLKIRPTLNLDFNDNTYAPTHTFTRVPADRRRVLLSTSLTLWSPQYKQARNINLLGITEDIQTGSWARLRLGASLPALGSDRGYPFAQLTLTPRGTPWPGFYVFSNLFFSSRWDRGSYANLRAWFQIKSVLHIGSFHSLALRFFADVLERNENNAQFVIGVENGLRGYAPRSLDGTRLLLANIAWRPTLHETKTYVLAGALFADTGSTWRGRATGFKPKSSVGFGMRLGLPQVYNAPVLRLDLAYGSAIQLSFGVGHYF